MLRTPGVLARPSELSITCPVPCLAAPVIKSLPHSPPSRGLTEQLQPGLSSEQAVSHLSCDPSPACGCHIVPGGGGGDQTLNILCQPLGTKQATRPASLLRAPRGDNGEFQMKDLLDTRLTRVVLATYLLVLAAAV